MMLFFSRLVLLAEDTTCPHYEEMKPIPSVPFRRLRDALIWLTFGKNKRL